jgi:hypothetical protein
VCRCATFLEICPVCVFGVCVCVCVCTLHENCMHMLSLRHVLCMYVCMYVVCVRVGVCVHARTVLETCPMCVCGVCVCVCVHTDRLMTT